MQHLNYEEMERYLNEEDLSEEYLLWLEPVMEHLDSCDSCREKINQLMWISEMCNEKITENCLGLLREEEKVRQEIVAYQLEKAIQDARMKEVIERLKMGLLPMIMLQKADFLKYKSVMRGENESSVNAITTKLGTVVSDAGIRVRYARPKMYVSVPCGPEETVTVIVALQEEMGVTSFMAVATKLEAEGVAIAEFEVEELGEKYEIYVDVQ